MSLFLILRPRIRVLLFAFICTVSLVFALMITKEVGSAAGNTITVNSTSDVANTADGVCTLREAITAANSNTASGVVAGECAAGSSDGSDTIDLTGVTGSITLTSVLPNISSDMTLNGPGTSNLTIQRSTSNFSIFNVDSIATVNISGLTIQGGTPEFNSSGVANTGNGTLNLSNCAVSGFDRGVFNSSQRTLTMTNCVVNANRGGVVSFAGTVNVVNSTISGNTGDGIENSFATLNVTSSTITGNTGGLAGIRNGLATNATIINSTVSNNTERGVLNNGNLTMIGGSITGNANGGAILGGTSVLNGVTVSANSNVGGTAPGGGGIFTNGNSATIINCLVTNNSTIWNGGGIRNGGGKATIVNTTISGNTSNGGGGGIDTVDGGLGNFVGINLTITGNRASFGGGVLRESGPMKFKNSLIAGNFLLNGTTPSDISGTVDASSSFNLVGVGGSGGLTDGVNNNLVGVADPGLGPLANNGGLTLTHSLLSNSQGLDAGDNCVTEVTHCGEPTVPQVTTDQRGPGFNRIVDGPDADTTATVDIGAYETQLPLASLPNTATNEDTQLVIPFDAGDTTSITSINATSSNPTLVPNDVAHLSAVLAGSTGVITVNPAANLFGTTDLTVTVNRTGGPDVKTFMLTVNSSNDAPSFTGSDQTVNEDAGPQTIGNWATNLSPGPVDEAGQTLTFQVTANTNAGLFSAGPAISSTGTLTYTPAANANGVATVTIVLKDTGGTENGGVDTSPAQAFVITINSVNDAPSFTKGPDQTVNEDAGTSFASWATNVSTGAANELQALTFEVTNNTNPTLFSTGPVINFTGALSFTPAPNMNGSATITIRLKDNGGTANGGVDSSSSQTFTVTVLPVNDPPTFTRGPSPVVNEDAGPQSVANWATNISPGPADEAGQTISITVENNNHALFSTQPTLSADGTLTYTPAANANGFATVTVILQDNGGTASGGLDIFGRNFSISVIAVNDPPVNTVPGAHEVEKNTVLIFSATNSNQISINDVDAGNAAMQVTLTASNGVLTLNGTTGLTFSVGTGAANSNMTFTGTISNINAALNGMSFAPTNNFEGIAELQISTNDLGNSGGGGAQSDTDTVNIVVGSTVQFSASGYAVVEGSELVTITVTRIAGSGPASVNYSTSDGSASGGVSCAGAIDYVSQSGTLSWTAGETTAKTFTVRICEDAVNEPDESVNLTLSGVTGNASLGAPQIAVLTIVNASPPVLLTEENTDHAIALDSVTLTRDPFSLTHPVAFSTDNRRRISLFVWRLAIRPTDTPSNLTVVAEDNEGRVYPLTVEFVGPISGPPLVNQVVVRLPDDVVGAPRDLFMTVQLRGSATNQAFIKIAGP